MRMYDPKRVACFGWTGYGCSILRADAPRDCDKCSFRKPEREVTDGIRFPIDGLPERIGHADA